MAAVKLSMKTLDDSGIISHSSENKNKQTVLISYGGLMYRITVNHDSYERQSYVRLDVMSTEREWTFIKSVNPHDYTGLSYVSQVPYTGPIADLKKVIKKTYEVTPK